MEQMLPTGLDEIDYPTALAITRQIRELAGQAVDGGILSQLTGHANAVGAELAGGWQDAWRYELRGPHGEWVRSVSSQVIPSAGYSKRDLEGKLYQMVNRAMGQTGRKAQTAHLINAVDALRDDDWQRALDQLYEAAHEADKAMKQGRSRAGISYRKLGDAIEEHYTQVRELENSMETLNAESARHLPDWLGGGREKWDGEVTVFPQASDPSVAGTMEWGGSMRMSDSAARDTRDAISGDGPARPGSNIAVSLHELIHGIEEPLPSQRADRTERDDQILRLYQLRDNMSPDAGASQHVFTLETINQAHPPGEPDVSQAEVDGLIQRGFLRRASFVNIVQDPGGGSHAVPLFGRTEQAVRTDEQIPDKDRHSKAYQNPAVAKAEEGFTELGTVHHMTDWLDSAGAGGRETTILARDDHGNLIESEHNQAAALALSGKLADIRKEYETRPLGSGRFLLQIQRAENEYSYGDSEAGRKALGQARDMSISYGDAELTTKLDNLLDESHSVRANYRHFTLHEYADQLNDPDKINTGKAWGHYEWETAAAQTWTQQIAEAEGHHDFTKGSAGHQRMIELADEVNREGPAGKFPALARQIIRAAGADPAHAETAEAAIQSRWPIGSRAAAGRAFKATYAMLGTLGKAQA
jgi:hypothetical protein